MSENDSESLPLDSVDWEIAFEPYKGYPMAALTLAFHLAGLMRYIGGPKADEACAAIDRAIECLFEYSQFREVGYELFQNVVKGKITIEQERVVRELGIKF